MHMLSCEVVLTVALQLDKLKMMESEEDIIYDYFKDSKDDYDHKSGRKVRIGDIVCSTTDGRIGEVVELSHYFCMYNQEDLDLWAVPSKKIQHLTTLVVGDFVLLPPWLGKVYAVSREPLVKFEIDGSVRQFKGTNNLYPCLPDWDISPKGCEFHPGQRVWASDLHGTVVEIKTGHVAVDWIVSAMSSNTNSSCPPGVIQHPDDLKLLDFCPHLKWQVGDVCRHSSYPESVFLVVDIRTRVNVIWQDGNVQKDLESSLLKPISDLGPHEFLVGQHVVKDKMVGFVKSIDPKENSTTVEWLGSESEETLSSFHLVRDQSYNHRHGNLVYRKIENESDFNLLCFGIVIGSKKGLIEVRWADGTISTIQPQVINSVDRDDYWYITSESDESDGMEFQESEIVDEIQESQVDEIQESQVDEIQESQVDLLDFIELSCVECLNQNGVYPISNALEQGFRDVVGLNLESVVDDQLLIYIPFKQLVNLHSIVIRGHAEKGPKTLKFFSNKENFGFSDINLVPPSYTDKLSVDNLKGKPLNLKRVKFQNIQSLIIFIEDNQSNSKHTMVQQIVLYGKKNI